jgi:hypothetical protein
VAGWRASCDARQSCLSWCHSLAATDPLATLPGDGSRHNPVIAVYNNGTPCSRLYTQRLSEGSLCDDTSRASPGERHLNCHDGFQEVTAGTSALKTQDRAADSSRKWFRSVRVSCNDCSWQEMELLLWKLLLTNSMLAQVTQNDHHRRSGALGLRCSVKPPAGRTRSLVPRTPMQTC